MQERSCAVTIRVYIVTSCAFSCCCAVTVWNPCLVSYLTHEPLKYILNFESFCLKVRTFICIFCDVKTLYLCRNSEIGYYYM